MNADAYLTPIDDTEPRPCPEPLNGVEWEWSSADMCWLNALTEVTAADLVAEYLESRRQTSRSIESSHMRYGEVQAIYSVPSWVVLMAALDTDARMDPMIGLGFESTAMRLCFYPAIREVGERLGRVTSGFPGIDRLGQTERQHIGRHLQQVRVGLGFNLRETVSVVDLEIVRLIEIEHGAMQPVQSSELVDLFIGLQAMQMLRRRRGVG